MSKSSWPKAVVAIAALTLTVVPGTATASREPKTGSITQVGHEPLMNRGMNAAIAIQGDYAYIGSRTDGGHEGQPQGGGTSSHPTMLAHRAARSQALTGWRA